GAGGCVGPRDGGRGGIAASTHQLTLARAPAAAGAYLSPGRLRPALFAEPQLLVGVQNDVTCLTAGWMAGVSRRHQLELSRSSLEDSSSPAVTYPEYACASSQCVS